nr:RNA-directed DNA polymerase, eukaryota [Tanacetum cinerariifolium]
MREVYYDYGPVPFRFFHYWFEVEGFDKFIEDSWKEAPIIESNALMQSLEVAQKAKIKWAIEGDENSKYYHVSKEEIKKAVWDCGIDKSPGPDEFTFGFYRRYWNLLENDVVDAVSYFFHQVDVGLFKGIELALSLNLSHMFYVDDAIFMGQWSESNIDSIIQVLECFNHVSGLRINMTKSKLSAISVKDDKVEQAAVKIGCNTLQNIFSYLGSNVGGCSSLWARVIKALHGDDRKIGKKAKSCYPSILLDIIQEVKKFKSRGIDLVSLIHSKLGNGPNTTFWEVVWRGESVFKILYPRLYALKTQKQVVVASKLSHSCLDVSFRRPPRGGVEQFQFELLKEKVEGCILADMMDRWFWALEGSSDFTVASVRKMIDDFMLPEVSSKTHWIKAVLVKFCVESTSHIFFTCQISSEILRKISRWRDIDYMEVSSYEEWLDWILNMRFLIKHKQSFEVVCYVLWWHVWRFRNKCIFGSQLPSKALIFDDVVSRSFYWCRYRCKMSYSLIEWLKNPHLISL